MTFRFWNLDPVENLVAVLRTFVVLQQNKKIFFFPCGDLHCNLVYGKTSKKGGPKYTPNLDFLSETQIVTFSFCRSTMDLDHEAPKMINGKELALKEEVF